MSRSSDGDISMVMTSYENEIETLSECENQAFPPPTIEITEDHSSISVNCVSAPDQNIVTQPLTGGPMIVRNYRKTAHYLPLAIIVTFVNCPFGLTAVVFSVLSKKCTKNGDAEEARKYAKISIWLSVIGIATALVGIVFALVYLFVITPNIIRSVDIGHADLDT